MIGRNTEFQTGVSAGSAIGAYGVWFGMAAPSLSFGVIVAMGVAAAAGALVLGQLARMAVR